MAQLKGVYTLNPTKMIMKQGSAQARAEVTKSKPKPAKALVKRPSKVKGK